MKIQTLETKNLCESAKNGVYDPTTVIQHYSHTEIADHKALHEYGNYMSEQPQIVNDLFRGGNCIFKHN